jgi:hypothetical protein
MNYKKIYENLINRGKSRIFEGYTESHHVIPKCIGGTDTKDNLVRLTPEEHYIAHQLLVKIHPDNHALVKAACMMIPSRPSNKLYGWLRRKLSATMSESQTGKGNSQYNTKWICNYNLQESKKIPINQPTPTGWENGRIRSKKPEYNKCSVCNKLKNANRKFCSLSCSAIYNNSIRNSIFDNHLEEMIKDYKNGMSIYKCLTSRNLCGTGSNHVKLSKEIQNLGVKSKGSDITL